MSESSKVVLVTGAGRGLGRAIANRYRDAGFTVVATDFDESSLEDISAVEGYVTAQQDVTDIDRAAEISALIREQCGRLDVIVNNAGVNAFLPVSEAPPQKIIQHFMVNTFAAVIVPQACLDLLIESKGRVVNISSESSTFRAPFQTYQSSKMALECLSDVMRRELMFHDVHVTFIRPGAIRTDLFAGTTDMHIDAPENSRYASIYPKLKEMVAKNIPANVSEPSEVAELVYIAGTDNKKKAMYTINNKFLYKIIAKLPASIVDKGIKKDLS
jgi:NAD(P)-dependent dehydrogenase (short-subunit alcohol dehydrogenase family)